ncbi:uncharacterized protein LOC135492972 [Lineus longissimus]|uniref:uncharacterized protein LOC135492972 n=1 Tax=Lineus longissimus TaxID=88925 RepID=UPI00315D227D
MPKLGKAYPGREGPPTVCRCGNEPDSNESQHAASPVRRAVGDQRRGSATSGESVNATSVTRVEEPMDVDLSNEESQDTNRQKRKSHNDAPAKDSHLQDMANSLEQPVCHGTSPDQPCNTPITTEHFCESCGQKNKYIQCLGSRKDDASPCKTFVEPGHSCPCCGQHAKPTTASAVVEKKQITEMSVNLRPCYQKNVKESELRGKPTAQHDVENHGKIDSINVPRKNERDCTHPVGKDRATNLGKTDSKNNLGKNDSTKSLDEDCPQTEDISTLEVASGGASGSDNFGAMTHPASKKVFGEPIANGSKMFKNRSLSGENKTEVDGGDASATTAEEQKNQRSESACQSQTTKETGDADQSKTNTEAAKGESDSLESKDPHEISKEDGTTNCAEPSDPKTEHELGDEGEDAKNGNQESQGAGAGHENESGGKPYRKGQEKNLVEGTKTTRGNKKESKKGKNKENTTVHTSQHLQTKGKTQGKRQVRFYVALHKDFHYNHANDSVCIRFHHPHLGGFAESKHRMEKVKDFSEGYVLFELTVVMPDSITCRLQYKYVFFHQTDKNAKPNFLYEWIPGYNKKEQPSHNRILDMTKLQKDVLHQYDGLMHPPAEGISWWEKVKKTFTGTSHKEHKEHMDEVKEVTLAMLPRWHYFYCETREDQELIAANAEEVVERISSVYRYMESSFKNEDQQTKSNKWKEILWQYLKPWKDHTRTQLAGKHPTKEEAKIHLVSALSVVDLICKFDGHILADLADLDLVLDCLLLRPDENGDIRHVIECVREHFKDPMKSLLGPLQSIIKFLVNKVAEAHIAQKWLYIVPLIHLLMEDSCQQYCDEHQTAQWWGVCLFNEQQEKFKRNMEFGSELQLDFLVEQLCPLFGVDPLLPRTLMTTLSWKHLLDAIPLPCFPPDACIALCYHFIKVKDFILYREDQQVIEKCFELVVDKIEGLQSEPVDVVLDSHDERIMKSDILLNISMNLLELLIKETSVGCRWYQERIMVADAAGVLAASMKYCSHLRKLLSVQDQEFSLRFRSTLIVARDRIVNWLSLVLPRRIKMHNMSFFDDHLEPQVKLS